jgi:plastocyanin
VQGIILGVLLAVLLVTPVWADTAVSIEEPSADINSWSFDPLQVTIQAGQTITWTNNGMQAHTATANNGAFDTGLIEPGESKTVALAAPGGYEYICTPHPWMTGNIIVTAAAGAAQPAPTPAAVGPTPVPKPVAQQQVAPTPTPFRIVTSPAGTAPRAGSMPVEMSLPLVAGGAAAAIAGLALLRRRKS